MDKVEALRDWLDDASSETRGLFAKRLSANDTGLTGGHQVGPYLPRDVAQTIAPELTADRLNPSRRLDFELASHEQRSRPVLHYYNNRFHVRDGTRNEFHLTAFGGHGSAMQDPENTGSILLIAFRPDSSDLTAWLSDSPAEEVVIESAIGPVEPGATVLWRPDGPIQLRSRSIRPRTAVRTYASCPRHGRPHTRPGPN